MTISNVRHQAPSATWSRYSRYDWGDVIEGTADQLRALGLGCGQPYPGEAGGPKRRMTVHGPNGESVRIKSEGSEFCAHVCFAGWPESPSEPDQPSGFRGVSYRPSWWTDKYTGTADALVAAGLVPAGHFPGMAGMRKVRVTIFADGTLPGGAPTANSSRRNQPGARCVEQVSRSLFRVEIYIDDAEHERRDAAGRAKDEAWSALVRGLPRPPMLSPLGASATWSPTASPARTTHAHREDISMANVTLLPTAAAEPLPKQPRYGRYPAKGNVRPISAKQIERRNAKHNARTRAEADQRRLLQAAEIHEIERRDAERWRQEYWPFPDIDRLRFDALTGMQQGEIQWHVRQLIESFEVSRG